MVLLITKEEIINNFDWERFCKTVEKDFDVNKSDSFTLTLDQAKKSGIIKNQDLQFQTVYKNRILTDCYDNIEEVLEDIEFKCSKASLEKRAISIEVLMERDYKRKNGGLDDRLTLEELSKDFLNTEYEKNKNKIEELKELVNKMNQLMKK